MNEIKLEAIKGYNKEKEILVVMLVESDSKYSDRQDRIEKRLVEIDAIVKDLTSDNHLVLPPAIAYSVQDIASDNKCAKCGCSWTGGTHVC